MGSLKPANNILLVLMSGLLVCLGLNTVSGQELPKGDVAYINKLIDRYNDSFEVNPQFALASAQEVVGLSERAGYKEGLALGLLAAGKLNLRMGNRGKAEEYLQKGLKVSKQYALGKVESKILHQLGTIRVFSRDFNAAFAYFTEALYVNIAIKDSIGIAKSYVFLGNCFSEQDNFSEAIKNLKKAADIYTVLHMPEDYANLCTNLSATYFNHNDFALGLNYLYSAIHIYGGLHDTAMLSNPYDQLGRYFQVMHRYDSAIYYYQSSLKMAVSSANKAKEVASLFSLAGLYDDMGDYKNAETYYVQALNLSRNIYLERFLYDIPYDLALMFVKMHDYKRAFEYLDTAYNTRDSLFNNDKVKELAEMNARYNNDELESKNELLKRENDLSVVRAQRKNILVYSGFGAAFSVLVIGFLAVRQNRLRNNQKLLQVEQKQLLAQMNPHFIFNCLNSIQQYIVQKDAENANRYLADFALLMRQTLDNSRDGMIPLQREIDYLENYLSLEGMRFENKFSYTITCAADINRNNVEIPSMIIQPFVENAIHHGLINLENKKGVLGVSFLRKGDYLFCEVEDNGIGMAQSQKLKDERFIKYQSHGMDLTRQRLALVSKMNSAEYQVTVVDKMNEKMGAEGTKIVVKFPLKV